MPSTLVGPSPSLIRSFRIVECVSGARKILIMTELSAEVPSRGSEGTEFLKGHGTENDFVLLPDESAAIDLTADMVRSVCGRRAGLGADGVLRIARAGALVDAGVLGDLPEDVRDDMWFMDYRNADGSLAEMCGNGIRVFAHALVATGRAQLGEIDVGTRAGLRPTTVSAVRAATASVSVDMGTPRLLGTTTARIGADRFPGIGVDVGNPHLACVVPGLDENGLAALDVAMLPGYDSDFFPEGVNVEIATPLVDGRVHMRVHERGAGETRSCGTGIVATAFAALADADRDSGDVTVSVPGGEVHVSIERGRATMTGPSVLVAAGRLWL